MAAITSLLNPAPEMSEFPESDSETPRNERYTSTHSFRPSRKKQKVSKDAAVFTRGPVLGECRYPPDEYQDEMLEAQHQQFEVYPMGEIADYPRHIPYTSEKKLFYEKTGREALEVFQYNFKVPGDDASYAMLWDYNIGLVRTTPLFKCTGHSKTTPAKMLNRNPGLRNICHSITGGALVAQGYWMPYEAAKAVAATFCWKIRYALTPVFGTDFPAMCIHPNDEAFGDMIINPAITKLCTEKAKMYLNLEASSAPQSRAMTPLPRSSGPPATPRPAEKPRPKSLRLKPQVYASDTGSEDNYSPIERDSRLPHQGLWTPANTPRSVPRRPSYSHAAPESRPSTSNSSSDVSTPNLSPKSRCTRPSDNKLDVEDCQDSGIDDVAEGTRKVSIGVPSDEKAAYLLMSLKIPARFPKDSRGKKRRASA